MCNVFLISIILQFFLKEFCATLSQDIYKMPDLDIIIPKSDKEIEYKFKIPPIEQRLQEYRNMKQFKKNEDEDNNNFNNDYLNDEAVLLNSSKLNVTPIKYNTSLESNVSRILDAVIASHDRRIRPNYGGAPTEVNVTVHVITISAVSEVSMDYTVDLYLRQFWRDPRLAFKSPTNDYNTSLTVGIDMVKSIWVSDTFFPNEKKSFFHETTTHNSFLRIDSNGNVVRSIRLTVTANCPMNLQTFPLDVQVCALEIESYGYSTSDIIYHWHHLNAVTIDENVHLAHFTIGDNYHIERYISLSNYSRLTAYFTFKRNIGFYLIQIYFPSSLIVVISWVSFFLNREATQARVTIGVTTVLTQTTLMTNANASLPKVSYVKSLDVFLGVCFFIVFAGLLEYAAVGYLMKRQRHLPYYNNNASHNKVGRESTVFYYELDEQPISTQLNKIISQNCQQNLSNTMTTTNREQNKKILMRRNMSINELQDQSRPLLYPTPTHTTAAATAALLATSTNNHRNSRMSILIPDLPHMEEEPIKLNKCLAIRPSQYIKRQESGNENYKNARRNNLKLGTTEPTCITITSFGSFNSIGRTFVSHCFVETIKTNIAKDIATNSCFKSENGTQYEQQKLSAEAIHRICLSKKMTKFLRNAVPILEEELEKTVILSQLL